jgi:general secretion pathway protein A
MYTHFYGFSEEPFRDTPDPRFLFAVPGNEHALNCLTQGIQDRKGWIHLSGEPGSGKTVLIRHLLQVLQGKLGVKTVYIFQTRISFEDLLKEILSQLNLPPVPPAGVSIAGHFSLSVSPFLNPRETLVLFFDEAQDFSLEALEKISLFFGKEYPHPEQVQIILSGQAPLEEKLNSQELRFLQQRIKARCRIRPLADQEARRYIEHRLHLAGGKPEIFTPEALNLIVRYGEGIPRTLSIIGDNALRIGHQISEPTISASVVRKALKEMYIHTGRDGVAREPGTRTPFFRKSLYSGAAVLGLLTAIFFAWEYSREQKVEVKVKAETPPAATRKPEPPPPAPKPEEKPAPKTEAEPFSPEKGNIPEPPAKQALTAPVSFPGSKTELKAKKTITVEKGATLNSLCWEHYGFTNVTLLDHIMVLNPEVTNPNLILINQNIRLPEIREESLLRGKSNGKFQVFIGTFPYPDIARTYGEEPFLKGKKIEIILRKLASGEIWHRLAAGDFENREAALKALRALKEKGLLPSFGGSPPRTGKNT